MNNGPTLSPKSNRTSTTWQSETQTKTPSSSPPYKGGERIESWHTADIKQILSTLLTDQKTGLKPEQAESRLRAWGANRLPEGKRVTALSMLLRQFKSPLVYILLIAAVLTWAIGDYSDMTVILVVVAVNALVGLFQEYRANQIFAKLKSLVKIHALVIREGRLTEIDSEQIVPGDIFLLKGGSKIPADARVLTATNLEANEAILTGESKSVRKQPGTVEEKAVVGDRTNMVFMGTVIERGEGRAVVVATGAATEIGKISTLTQSTADEISPLSAKMAALGKFLSTLFVALSIAIFIVGVLEGDDPIEMIKTTIAIAVAAIPEGLPAAISIILAVSSQKILHRKGLVRKLVAAETLGSTTLICTDKTGTLTYGKMKVEKILGDDEQSILSNLALANEAVIEEKENTQIVRGEATDKAKLEKFLDEGLDLEKTLRDSPRLGVIPFDENRKYIAAFHKKDGKIQIFINGAPETILNHSLLPEAKKNEIKKTYENLARQGYRVLGVAQKKLLGQIPSDPDIETMAKEINNLTFLGLVALRDPIREDVRQTLNLTKQAGIKVVMMTGDHVLTARAIGLELGFGTSDRAVMLGEDLEKLSDTELIKRVKDLEIIARVTPVHKMRFIKIWQKLGAVVAMTGDGVNDAPALKAADIGIAVGSGTDVSREAADLVLLDDSFSTITAAVAEGRTGFANIRKATITVMSNAFTEIVLIGSTLIFATPFLPITAIQILWVNLAEDSLPVLAMAFEPQEKEVMKSKPTSTKESILDNQSKFIIFAVSIVSDITLVGIFLYLLRSSGWEMLQIQSFMFVATATPTLYNVLAFKSFKKPIYQINVLNNKFLLVSIGVGMTLMLSAIYLPFLNGFLRTVPLGWKAALVAFIFFPVYKLILVELTKWWYRSREWSVVR